MARFYLNKLIDKKQGQEQGSDKDRLLKEPTDVGAWKNDEEDEGFLGTLAHDIDVGKGVRDSRLAHSVPSVYARPIVFSNALAEEENPLHHAVVSEWRGLMAVFALKSWIEYKLEFEDYKIEQRAGGEESHVGNVPRDDLHLRTMLRSLLPEPREYFTPLKLIYVNGTMVGGASPWTLAFTPAGKIPDQIVPWARDGVLKDPIEIYKDRKAPTLELTIISRWIDLVLEEKRKQLNWGMDQVDGDLLSKIDDELAKWKGELQEYVDLEWTVPGLAEPLDENAGLYKYALRTPLPPKKRIVTGDSSATEQSAGVAHPPVQAAAESTQTAEATSLSDLFLKGRDGASNVVVLKRKGLPNYMRVHNGAFVEDIDIEHLSGSSGKSLVTKGGVIHPIEWVMAEEVFFPPKIARVNLSPQALSCGSGAAAEYSLPLATAFFKYFTHADVSKMLQVVVTGTGNDSILTATVNLPLQGEGDRKLPLEKTYTVSQALADVGATTPAFGLWPNFVSDDWTHNFATFVGPYALGDAALTVKPLLVNGTVDNPTNVDGAEKDLRIWRSMKPLSGFAIFSNGGESGLVLRKWLHTPEIPVQGRKWIVSVDFGTANTMIRCRAEGGSESGKESSLELKPRLVLLNNGAAGNMWKLSNALYPQEGATPPFRTLLYTLDATTWAFDTDPFSLRFEFLPADVKNLVRDLKWGRDPAAMRAYLKLLVRYIVCEARDAGVEELILQWSYPLALPETSCTEMSDFWRGVAGEYTRATLAVHVGHTLTSGKVEGSEPTDRKATTSEDSVSESEATCRALAWHPASEVPVLADGLCIAIDVGGGSTDFAYWSHGELLDQFSFKLAGNDILCGQWIDLPGFLEKITWAATGATRRKEELEPLLEIKGNQVEVMINHVLSQAVNNAGVSYTESNPLNHPAVIRIFSGGHAASPWLQIRTLALLLFGGISYYAGLHARDFINRTKMKNHITLCFGGRGSNLLAWLSNNPRQLQRALRSFLTGGYRFDNSSVPQDLTVNVVGAPVGGATNFPPLKEEVARGILSKAISDEGPPPKKPPYVGELGWSQRNNPAPVQWNDRLTVEEMANLVPPQDVGKWYIADFLHTSVIQNPEVSKLNIDMEGIKSRTLTIDRVHIQNMLVQDIKGTGVSQPLFAIELKSLMKKYVAYAIQSHASAPGL